MKAAVTQFIRSIASTPPSTGTMMDDCVAEPNLCKTQFTYEDLAIQTNEQLVKEGHEPLYIVYPIGSLAISDAPLGFLPHGSDSSAKEANFKALEDYLLSPEGQAKAEAIGRRPTSSIGLSLPGADPKVFNPAWGVQANLKAQTITYPAAPVIEKVLDNYQLAYRRPVDIAYCLDGSGSMDSNGGWNGVEASVKLLFDPVQAQQLSAADRPDGPDDRARLLGHDQPRQDRRRQRRRRISRSCAPRSRRRARAAARRSTTASRRRPASSRRTRPAPGRS